MCVMHIGVACMPGNVQCDACADCGDIVITLSPYCIIEAKLCCARDNGVKRQRYGVAIEVKERMRLPIIDITNVVRYVPPGAQ